MDDQNVKDGSNTQPLPDNGSLTKAQEGDSLSSMWITKFKSIVISTRDDPYMQAQQIAQLRASYIQARYGKAIKLPEDQK